MLEWINEDFFWVSDNSAQIYNINSIIKFSVKESGFQTMDSLIPQKMYWIHIDVHDLEHGTSVLEVKSREDGIQKIIDFLKNRPNIIKVDNKILID